MRSKAGFFPVKTLNGAPPALRNFPLVGGTAYYEGAVLRLSATSGSAARATAAGTVVLGVLACDVASADAATGKYPVYLADGNTMFKAKMLLTSVPQQKMTDLVGLSLGTVHNYRLQGTAATEVCRIEGFNPDEALTTHTGVEYWVTFNPDKSLSGASHNAN
jgi:hypothetical protein